MSYRQALRQLLARQAAKRRARRSTSARQRRRRIRWIEPLEPRQMMASTVWHNVLQPLDVSGDSDSAVVPLDALLVINELNDPSYSQPHTGTLVDLPPGIKHPFLDVSCDATVSPLDALIVINALNGPGSSPSWRFASSDSPNELSGQYTISNCSPQLIEGHSLATTLSQRVTLPNAHSAIRVSFEAPQFDSTSRDSIRDAFELLLLNDAGEPLSLPYSVDRNAAYNWSEELTPALGPGSQSGTQSGTSILTTTFNLAGVAAGTPVTVVARLVNNDADVNTSVVIRRVEVIESSLPPPVGRTAATPPRFTPDGLDSNLLTDVSSSVRPIYGRTTLVAATGELVTDLQLRNEGATAVSGRVIVAIDRLSDPAIGVMHPDGILPGGRPYFVLGGTNDADWLAPGESSGPREIRFANVSQEMFTYTLTTLAEFNAAPTEFTSMPQTEIEAGQIYRLRAQAADPDGQPLRYSVAVGPPSMNIDSATGQVSWTTTTADVGNHSVVLRATDPYGLHVDQAFTITVQETLPNRPPVITSTPPTDAIIAAPFEVQTYATGQGPVAVTVGEFGTGTSFVTANAGDAELGFLGSDRTSTPLSIGEPDPAYAKTSFVMPVTVDLGFVPGTYTNLERDVSDFQTADVNSDGNPDLIALVYTGSNDVFNPACVGRLGIRLGNGDGTFRAGWQVDLPAVANAGSYASQVQYVDVTGDGIRDLVTAQYVGKTILVYRGLSGATFNSTPLVSAIDGSPSTLEMADVNADGLIDVVIFEAKPNGNFRNGLSIHLGHGDGTFGPDTFYAAANGNGGAGYVVDVDGRNGPDLLRVNYNDQRFEVMLNDGAGAFGSPIFNGVYGIGNNGVDRRYASPMSAYLGDFDGDGMPDASIGTAASGLYFLKGLGDGRFGDGTRAGNRINNGDSQPTGVNDFPNAYRGNGQPVDFNGDGKLDVIYGDGQLPYLTIGLGRGDGTFALTSYNAQIVPDIGTGLTQGQGTTIFHVADVNRDGVLDILANTQANFIRPGVIGVFLGDQVGTLRATRVVPLGERSWGSQVAGDFTGDGIPDLAMHDGQGVIVAKGHGDGTFDDFQLGLSGGPAEIHSLVTADFDGDGHLDLAWQGYTGLGVRPTYYQAFGLGNGAFQLAPSVFPPQPANAGRSIDTQEVVAGDFNGDGHPDLAYRVTDAVGSGSASGGKFTRVDVLLYDVERKRFNLVADPTNILGPLNVLPAFYIDEVLGFADLDGDGHSELFAHAAAVKGYPDRPDTPERLYVWRPSLDVSANDASQLFTPLVIDEPHLNGSEKNTVVGADVGDFNGDGKPDFAAALNGATVVSYGNGDFTFRNPTTYLTNGRGVHVGDFNGDGIDDLVTNWSGFIGNSERPLLTVMLGNPDETFSHTQPLAAVSATSGAVAVGDFNLDGRTDFVTDGTGYYDEVFLAAPPGLAALQTGDISGDGKLDLVGITTGFNRVKLLLGDGADHFTRQTDLLVGASPVDLQLADMDGDGRLDVITANRIGQSITVLYNQGGSFTRSDYALAGRPNKVAVQDITGDGRPEVVAISDSGQQLDVLVNSETGLRDASALNLGFAPGGIALGDVTGDGLIDATLTDPVHRRLFILPGVGPGTFGNATSIPLTAAAVDIAVADMNFDNKLDIEVTLPESNRVGVLFNRGGARFTNPQSIAVGDGPNSLKVADTNNDGKPDLLVTNQDNTLSIIVNRFDPANLYRYAPAAFDPDGDPVTFQLDSAPGGMLYDEATGQVLWAPMPDQLGANAVVLRAQDDRGGATTQEYSIAVSAPTTMTPPVFTSQPVPAIALDSTFHYQPSTTNPGDNPLRFRLVSGPAAMTIDPTTGELAWDPRHEGLSLDLFRVDRGHRENRGYIQSADSPSLRGGSLSVEGWFRFNNLAGFQSLIRKNLFDQFFGYAASWSLENRAGVLVARVGDGTDSVLLAVDNKLPLDQWLHIAMTFDNATKILTLYVNGESVASGVAARSISYDGSNLIVGQNLLGSVTGVRIWNAALTPDELRDQMNREVPANAPGLVLDYDFHGGPDASSVLDRSPFANHGGINTSYYGYNFPTRIPALGDAGEYPVTIQVEDGQGGSAVQSFRLQIVSLQTGAITGAVSDHATAAQLAGWTAYVDANGNSYRDVGEPFVTTNANGQFTLSNLLATRTRVAIEPRAGYQTPSSQSVDVVAGATVTDNFEVVAASPGMIRGRLTFQNTSSLRQGIAVYVDSNDNHVRDEGEPVSFTDRLGDYVLSELEAGTKVVRVDTPTGWRVVAPISEAIRVVLGASESTTGKDFTVTATDAAASTPVFVSSAPSLVAAREQFRYPSVAVDPLAHPLTYELLMGPDSMAIDAATGVVVWTPTAHDLGETRVILRATNEFGGVALQEFSLTVTPANTAPLLSSSDRVFAVVNTPLRFDVRAQDAEQETLNYALTGAPDGMSIDARTGRIAWSPSPAQAGEQTATVLVSDGVGGTTPTVIHFFVQTSSSNDAPVITAGPRATGQVGRSYVGRVLATDSNDDVLTYSLRIGPTGMTITEDGRIEWTPSASQAGAQTLRVRVDDGRGGSDERDFNISIGSSVINRPPLFAPVESFLAVADKLFARTLEVSDADGDALAFELVTGPAGMSLDSTRGTLRWLPQRDQLGVHDVIVRALDPFAGRAELHFAITVRGVGGPPAITSIPPTSAAVGQTYLYAIAASDPDHDPLIYALSAAPPGMTINSATGIIAWTPTAAQRGPQAVIVRVSDGAGGFTSQSFSIQVTDGVPNQPPVIETVSILDAVVGVGYAYNMRAKDPEGSVIQYAVRSGPTNLTVDEVTGAVAWTPTAADIGTVVIVLAARDADGGTGVQSFLLQVHASNHLPVIVSTPSSKVSQGAVYRYDVIADDADHEPLTYELTSGPAGLTLDSLGHLKWTTALDTPLGPRSASVTVRDGRGGSATQTIDFEVVPDKVPPRITIIVQNSVLYPWSIEPARIRVAASDDVGVANIVFTVDGQPVALAQDGSASVYFSAPGNGKLRASAFDAAGNEGKAFAQVNMRTGGEDGLSSPPITTTITSHQNGDEVQGLVTVKGTAASADLTDYVLSYRRASESTYHEIRRGTSSVSDGILGTWDTTMLENDQYVLQLQVDDVFGGYASTERVVNVTGDLKLGNFRLSFVDVTIPVAGIPITLSRTYDTLQASHNGELGYGWSLDFRNTNLRTGLAKTGLENVGIYAAFKEGTKVYVTLPGGVREGFTFTPDLRVLPGFGNSLIVATPRFTPDRGVRDTLTVSGGTYIVNEDGELISGGGQPYNPAAEEFGGGYTITTPDGTVYRVDGNTGLLTSVRDRNNNTLTFTDTGISGPGGISLTFERDAKGRITKAIDPSGQSVSYLYDVRGDLIKVIDREGNTTQLTYRSTPAHYLESIVDALGRTGVRTEYDANGRLIGTTSATTGKTVLAYDPGNELLKSTDAMGRSTTYVYDARGNVLSETDALGRTKQFTFDDNNRQLSSTDFDGNTTRYTYDASGNETSRTDPGGNTRYWSYDQFGALLRSVDPLGNATVITRDAHGNLLTYSDPLGNTSSYQYNSRGLLTSRSDPAGYVTRFDYDAAGRLAAATAPDGTVTTVVIGALGAPTAVSTVVSTATGSRTLTINAAYDANGRLLSVTDADGHTSSQAFAADGRVASQTDPLGLTTTFQYDAAGNLIRTVRPDGSFIEQLFDDTGTATQATVPGGLTYQTMYDAAGFPTELLNPDGSKFLLGYDTAGRPATQTDANGRVISRTFDAQNRIVAIADGHGSQVNYTYDAAGRVTSTTDSLGRTTRFSYDAAGQVVQVTLPNGGSVRYEYDSRGNRTAETDALGMTTRYQFDAMNRLMVVTDAEGATTRYAYNQVGRLISETDARGQTTRYEYDGRGLQTAVITPLGKRSTSQYDAAGRLISRTNAAGETVTYVYTALNQVAMKTLPSGERVSYAYRPSGSIESVNDARGTTRYEYDNDERLSRVIQPDGRAVSYQYDSSGQLRALTTPSGTTTYTSNATGQLAAVQSPDGGTVTYTYDSAGQLTQTTKPDGTTEFRSYDALGNVTRVHTMVGNSTLSDMVYGYDVLGRQVTVNEIGVAQTTYAYDALSRLLSETRTAVGGSTSVIQYAYDLVGNRIRLTTDTGTTTYAYDADNRLTSTAGAEVATYTYDAAGRLVIKDGGPTNRTAYTWSAENRLLRVDVTTPSGTKTTTKVYDPAGTLVAEVVDGIETRYLNTSDTRLPAVVEEYAPNGTSLADYTYGSSLISRKTTAGVRYYHTDADGNVRYLTDSAHQIVATESYTAYGVPTETSGTSQPYQFDGERYDASAGLLYLRARHFDPSTGRFLSPDPWAGDVRSPVSRHKYQYAADTPTNASDPTGLATMPETQTSLTIGEGLLYIGAVQSVIGATLAIRQGVVPWNGPNYFASLGFFGTPSSAFAGIGLYTTLAGSSSDKPARLSTLLTGAFGESVGTNVVSSWLTKGVGGFMGSNGIKNLLNNSAAVGIGASFAGFNVLGANFIVSSETLLTPSLFGRTGGAVSAGVTGIYVAGNVNVSSGFLSLPAFAHSPGGFLDGSLFTSAGAQVSIEGLSFGYSVLNTQSELQFGPSISASVGLCFGFLVEDNVIDDRDPNSAPSFLSKGPLP